MRHLTPILLLAVGVICTPAYAESVVPILPEELLHQQQKHQQKS